MSEQRRPYHVLVAISACAGVYAGSLAAVTALQIEQDRATIADRQPVVEAIDILGRHHGVLEARLAEARTAYNEATGEYAGVANALHGLHAGLTTLDRQVAAAEALARQGISFTLPIVEGTAPVAGPRAASAAGAPGAAAPAPAVIAAPAPVVQFTPLAAPAPAPKQHGKTGASGP